MTSEWLLRILVRVLLAGCGGASESVPEVFPVCFEGIDSVAAIAGAGSGSPDGSIQLT